MPKPTEGQIDAGMKMLNVLQTKEMFDDRRRLNRAVTDVTTSRSGPRMARSGASASITLACFRPARRCNRGLAKPL
jgi:hypothetical protein